MTCRILVADDSTPIQKVIKIAFSKYAVEILTAGSLSEASKECERGHPDLIIADASLPGVSAASDFTRLAGKSHGCAMIILMGTYDAVRESDLRSAGLESILRKPFDAVELLESCERMIPGRLVPTSSNASGQHAPPAARDPVATPVNLPPPPAAFSQAPDLPAGVPSFLLEPQESPVMPSSLPQVDRAKKGLPAFEPGRQPPPSIPLARPYPDESTLRSGVAPAPAQQTAEDLLRSELPGMVERAVARYCNEHFREIAKEILTAELRRLADEKARYLVDQ